MNQKHFNSPVFSLHEQKAVKNSGLGYKSEKKAINRVSEVFTHAIFPGIHSFLW